MAGETRSSPARPSALANLNRVEELEDKESAHLMGGLSARSYLAANEREGTGLVALTFKPD